MIVQEFTHIETREPEDIARKMYELRDKGLRVLSSNVMVTFTDFGTPIYHAFIVWERDVPEKK